MPILPVSRAVADHYVWGTQCDGWHLLRGAGLSVIEERMPPATTEIRHWHARATQFFYCLDGTLTMEVEGAVHELSAGIGIHIPSGIAHQARNDSGVDVRFLVISQPPHQGDRTAA